MKLGWGELRRLPRPLWILAFATIVNRAGTMALPFLALYLTRHGGMSLEQAGIIVSGFGAGSLLIGPLGGWLSDRWGAMRVMHVSLLSSGLLLLFFPWAKSFTELFALTFLWALTTAVFRPAAYAIIAELSAPEDRQISFALNRMAINLGMSVGPAIGGMLAVYSFPLLFWVDGATTLVAGFILMWEFGWKRTTPAPEGKRESFYESMKLSLIDRHFVFFLLALLPVQIVFFQHETTMPLFLVHDLKMSESIYGLLFTINTVMIIVVELQLNLWLNQWQARVSVAIGCALFGVGFGLLAYVSGLPGVLVSTMIWTLGEMALFPGATAYLSDLAPAKRRGAYMGLYATSFSLAQVIAPAGGTYLMQRFSPSSLWHVCLVLGLLSAFLSWRIRPAH